MPHLFSFASSYGSEDAVQEMGEEMPQKHPRRSSLLKNLGGLWKRHHEQREIAEQCPQTAPPEVPGADDYFQTRRSSLPDTSSQRKAVPSLPRPQTFRRQESERREKLLEVPPSPTERRAVSVDRRRGLSASAARRPFSPKPIPLPHKSAPEIVNTDQPTSFGSEDVASGKETVSKNPRNFELPPLQIPDLQDEDVEIDEDDEDRDIDQSSLQEEYERRWILNLSMHFRDKSNREKFFVTYAETPYKWRRLTISLDYRNAPEDSLEADLSTLHYQRDKSFRTYEAIRESLPDIQYYNTVTNLKLETTAEDGQLHVHVREDANEIIQYPSIDLFRHIRAQKYRECDVEFISHLSGFVYKVRADDDVLIKKEIPGPDTVDEFLYEVNALDSLLGSRHVVQLEGLVTDDSGLIVKGLLISYASQGALVDMLFDFRNTPELPWYRREKWAKQIVQGLSDIHEAGFVQGDFTLSNIVIDHHDDAVIIDINRRGCPVGWEPPELGRLIDSGQRIGMCIGVKTDLFQLGMVLWALAEVVDEPERVERPLPRVIDETPSYVRRMVEACLSDRPQGRPNAKRLLRQFPDSAGRPPSSGRPSAVDFAEDVKLSDHSVSTHRSDKEYIDPNMAVTLEDVSARNRRREPTASPFTSDQVTYFDPREDPDSNPASTSYRFESSGSWVVGRRGRSPVSSHRRRSSPFARMASSSSATSLSRSPPSRSRRRARSSSSEDARVEKSPTDAECPPSSDFGAPGIRVTTDEESRPRPLFDKRIAAVQDEVVERQSPLLHTDSGFDEQMVEELDLGPAEEASSLPQKNLIVNDPRLAKAIDLNAAEQPDVSCQEESGCSNKAPTPGLPLKVDGPSDPEKSFPPPLDDLPTPTSLLPSSPLLPDESKHEPLQPDQRQDPHQQQSDFTTSGAEDQPPAFDMKEQYQDNNDIGIHSEYYDSRQA